MGLLRLAAIGGIGYAVWKAISGSGGKLQHALPVLRPHGVDVPLRQRAVIGFHHLAQGLRGGAAEIVPGGDGEADYQEQGHDDEIPQGGEHSAARGQEGLLTLHHVPVIHPTL